MALNCIFGALLIMCVCLCVYITPEKQIVHIVPFCHYGSLFFLFDTSFVDRLSASLRFPRWVYGDIWI